MHVQFPFPFPVVLCTLFEDADRMQLVQVILPLGDDPKEKRNGLKAKQNNSSNEQGKIVTGLTGENVCIRQAPDLDAVKHALQVLLQLLS